MKDINIKILTKPSFNKAEKVHDWRNYVLDEYKEIWKQLSLETRVAIYRHCRVIADSEEWD